MFCCDLLVFSLFHEKMNEIKLNPGYCMAINCGLNAEIMFFSIPQVLRLSKTRCRVYKRPRMCFYTVVNLH